MSNAVSALDGAIYQGQIKIQDAGLRGMITLRGDLGSAQIKKAASRVAGVEIPGPGQCNSSGEKGIAWMSPDEVLVMTPYDQVTSAVAKLEADLKGQHALVANVSDARCIFRLEGSVREVIAKLAPVDMSSSGFEIGQFRRTRLAQAPAAFWMQDEETLVLICFRSEAQYVFDLLSNAAKPGSEVVFL